MEIIGIDIGISNIKGIVVNDDDNIIDICSKEIAVLKDKNKRTKLTRKIKVDHYN